MYVYCLVVWFELFGGFNLISLRSFVSLFEFVELVFTRDNSP